MVSPIGSNLTIAIMERRPLQEIKEKLQAYTISISRLYFL